MNEENKIDVKTRSFENLFEPNNIIYEVPFFQRGYVWGKNEWNDLKKAINEEIISADDTNNKKCFFGTFVLKQVQNQQSSRLLKYSIIDGQQRFITIYVLCIALYKKLREIENTNKENQTESDKKKVFITNLDDKENNYNQLKVVSTRGNTLSIYKLLCGDTNPNLPGDALKRELELSNSGGAIGSLVNFIEKNITKGMDKETVIQWLDAILNSLEVVCIYLPDRFDEQIIFETLNAKGVELTTSELLCNYLFRIMDDKENKSSLHYEKWLRTQNDLEKIRNKIGNKEDYSDFESYLRYLFSMKQKKMLGKKRLLYYWFKEECTNSNDAKEKLDLISQNIEYFKDYINPHRREIFSKEIRYKLTDIQDIGIHSTIPFILQVLNALENKELSFKEGEKILSIVIVMLVRNRVAGTNPKYDVFFPNLYSKVNNQSDDIKQKIINNNFYIKDDKFIEELKNRAIYKEKDKKFPYYLLKSINFSMTNYKQDIDYSSFSQIEHVLPQKDKNKLSKEWKEELGDDINNEFFDIKKHTLGNLTIIGDGNQAVKDDFIKDKLEHNAYKSPIPPLTESVINIYREKEEWNLSTIEQRSEELAKIACKVWSWDLE